MKPCKRGHTEGRNKWGACVACNKVYRQTPEYKARAKVYRQTPEYKARDKARKQAPEYKERTVSYYRAYRLLSDKAIDREIDRNAKRRVQRASAR